MAEAEPRVYVVLLNWRSWNETMECLESLFRLDYPDFRVVVCDNDSGDGSVEYLRAWAEGRLDAVQPTDRPLRHLTFPPLKKPIPCAILDRRTAEAGGTAESAAARLVIVENGGNLGYSRGVNIGLRHAMARGDAGYVWLLNNDTVVDPGALSALVRRMAQDPSIGECGSTVLFYDEPDVMQCQAGGTFSPWLCRTDLHNEHKRFAERSSQAEIEARLDYLIGAARLVSRSYLETVGPLGEDYFLFFDEIDWAYRAGDRFRRGYAEDSLVYHHSGASTGSGKHYATSPLIDRLYLESRLIFSRKHLKSRMPLIYLTYLGAILNRVRRGQWDRVAMVLDVLFKGPKGISG